MDYEKIKDCIVVVPSAAKEYFEGADIENKAKKCFAVASDKVAVANEYLEDECVLNGLIAGLGSFALGLVVGLVPSKTAKKIAYLLAALSGVGILLLLYKKLFENK